MPLTLLMASHASFCLHSQPGRFHAGTALVSVFTGCFVVPASVTAVHHSLTTMKPVGWHGVNATYVIIIIIIICMCVCVCV